MMLLLLQLSWADLGPPPKCPKGTHRQYFQGYHCVPDGYHLTSKEGKIVTVKDVTLQPKTTEETNTKATKTQVNISTQTQAAPSSAKQNNGCSSVYSTPSFGLCFMMVTFTMLGFRRAQAQDT